MLSFYNVLNILYKSLQTYPIYKYTCCNIIFQKLLEMGDSKCFMNWLFPNNFITFADWFIFIQRKLLLFVKKEIQQLFLLLVLHVSQMEKQRGGWYKKRLAMCVLLMTDCVRKPQLVGYFLGDFTKRCTKVRNTERFETSHENWYFSKKLKCQVPWDHFQFFELHAFRATFLFLTLI